MTYREIISALEYCRGRGSFNCGGCPGSECPLDALIIFFEDLAEEDELIYGGSKVVSEV